MKFSSAKELEAWPSKAVTIMGMSGVGKTTLANLLRDDDWFHYSVDYRIGTRYMGEHIVDNFKREAMKNPFLRELLKTDSIFISSNITFDNLDPLSTYLGKPGNPDKGGIPFAEYKRRQAQHRQAEIQALLDVPHFMDKARSIYAYEHFISSNITFDNLDPLSTYLGKPGNPDKGGIPFAEYKRRQAQHRQAEIQALLDVPHFMDKARSIYAYEHFICDAGGSLCEVVNLGDHGDPVLKVLADNTMLLYIRGTEDHAAALVERFRKAPKPMYYQPQFLEKTWVEYKSSHGIADDNDVDPDDFIVWGFEKLLHHRIPLYEEIARRYGYAVEMADIPSIRDEQDFLALLARAISEKQ